NLSIALSNCKLFCSIEATTTLTHRDTIETAREWVLTFVRWYNHHHHHSGIKFVTPHARHSGKDKEILKNREKVYQEAKSRNPERWTGNIRNWDLIEKVDLNPDKEKMIKEKKAA
ncbi:MAG: hypothetical protein HOE60_04805, partial [Desulfobacula sp.]|nr:hypothetical protein [Desulfobacula sp.]